MTVQTEEAPAKVEKPRGHCTGCKFDYQLGTARKGDYKGQLVIRKHLSRTGPGECAGSQKPPKGAEQDQASGEAFADPAPVDDTPPYFTAGYDSTGSCGHEIMAGEEIRADGEGGFLCGLCSDEGPKPDRPQHVFDNGHGGVYVHEGPERTCMQDECRGAREMVQKLAAELPHDRTPETVNVPGAPVASVQEIPNGHDVTSTSGAVYRHGGPLAECTTVNCVQYRNRLNPPAVTTPVQHQCTNGLFADVRNCPEHGAPTVVVPLGPAPVGAAATVTLPEPAVVAGQLNGVPVGYTHAGADGLHQGRKEECTLSPCTTQAGLVFVDPHAREAESAIAAVNGPAPVVFADPGATPAELPPVSGQPEPDRDRWGRYLILGKSHTRATTFAKMGSSTYALGEWNERMLIKGLTQRPDLLAMAHGLDVKNDRGTLNKIADEAQETAGNKVAANIGTAYHSFTERLDAGLITLDQVPEQWRGRCGQYVEALAAHGLTTRPEWIERTTAVRADQVSAPVPVAGTLDRIFRMPNGDLVIGDLKTSSNIEYSWSEIAVQLALYAHGVNTHGLFDWNSKTWQHLAQTVDGPQVRTDYAIVVHLPAQGDGCVLYRVDLVKGWEFAQVSGLVQARQKAKDVAGVMVPLPQTVPAPVLTAAEGPAPVPATVQQGVPQTPTPRPELVQALELVRSQTDPNRLMPLNQYAVDSGRFTVPELEQITQACSARWSELSIPY